MESAWTRLRNRPGRAPGAGSRNSAFSKKKWVLKWFFFGAAADLDFPAPAGASQLESASDTRSARMRLLR
eukprot:6889336-Pyramimonas_sp.AAC.1